MCLEHRELLQVDKLSSGSGQEGRMPLEQGRWFRACKGVDRRASECGCRSVWQRHKPGAMSSELGLGRIGFSCLGRVWVSWVDAVDAGIGCRSWKAYFDGLGVFWLRKQHVKLRDQRPGQDEAGSELK